MKRADPFATNEHPYAQKKRSFSKTEGRHTYKTVFFFSGRTTKRGGGVKPPELLRKNNYQNLMNH